jgi:hypothetical protein
VAPPCVAGWALVWGGVTGAVVVCVRAVEGAVVVVEGAVVVVEGAVVVVALVVVPVVVGAGVVAEAPAGASGITVVVARPPAAGRSGSRRSM